MIEFTDRYGGNPPSRLRGCFACEAMGCNPEPPAGAIGADGSIAIDHPGEWTFVTCSECHGTARVSWCTTVTRIPRWLIGGLRFAFVESPRCTPDEPKYRSWWMGVKAALLADLGLWRP